MALISQGKEMGEGTLTLHVQPAQCSCGPLGVYAPGLGSSEPALPSLINNNSSSR